MPVKPTREDAVALGDKLRDAAWVAAGSSPFCAAGHRCSTPSALPLRHFCRPRWLLPTCSGP